METVNRRTTYRLHPTPPQEAALQAQREAHRLLYNAALEQRKAAWTRQRVSLGYAQQCRDLTELRHAEATPLPAQAAQHTLKWVDRAFQAFFRRAGWAGAWLSPFQIAPTVQRLDVSHAWGWLAFTAYGGHALSCILAWVWLHNTVTVQVVETDLMPQFALAEPVRGAAMGLVHHGAPLH